MTRIRRAVVGSLVAVTMIAAGDAAPASAHHRRRSVSTIMTGAKEAPNPGDRDGLGVAAVVVNVRLRRVCYLIAVTGIRPATMAHIHRGAVGAAGPIVVTLNAPTNGRSTGCVRVRRALAAEIAHAPHRFYVNVHNRPFGAGAVRGQL
jgi:CHRD domain